VNRFTSIVALILAIAALALGCGACSKTADTTSAEGPDSPIQASGGNDAHKQAQGDDDAAVTACKNAYEALFGAEGCVPNLMSVERIAAACDGYAQWASKGDACGSDAFAKYYNCLAEIDCKNFEGIYDTQDTANENYKYPAEFFKCREQFAKDLNLCLQNAQNSD
jgi:hypothetical protein